MKYLLIFLFPLCLKAQFLWQFYPDTVLRWNYRDGDEFNKPEIDKEKWQASFPWSKTVSSQEAVIRENNVKFKDGLISFIVDRDTSLVELYPWQIDTVKFKKNGIRIVNGNKLAVKYSIGLLWLNQPYQYGYFEVKFKAPQGQGIWPAFWLYAAKENNEIDFLELKGEKENSLHVDIHCPDGCRNFRKNLFGFPQGWGHWLKTDRDLKSGFNILAGEWTPQGIKFYLNGILIAYAAHNFEMGMNLIVGTGIAKDRAAFKPGPNKATPFPNSFLVDYVRIYKTDAPPDLNEIKKKFSSSALFTATDTSAVFAARKLTGKLLNNSDKKLKSAELLTISAQQISKTEIAFRVVGVKKTDVIFVSFKTGSGKIIRTLEIKQNLEMIIPLTMNTDVQLEMTVNNKTVKETIALL